MWTKWIPSTDNCESVFNPKRQYCSYLSPPMLQISGNFYDGHRPLSSNHVFDTKSCCVWSEWVIGALANENAKLCIIAFWFWAVSAPIVFKIVPRVFPMQFMCTKFRRSSFTLTKIAIGINTEGYEGGDVPQYFLGRGWSPSNI